MVKKYSSTRRKQIAYLLIAAMGINIFAPSASYALTGGPSQPEFSSFEPVSTNQMVDEFTGDFTYNIPVITVPGPQGSEYPLSLSYHSGVSSEDEASWVGYGWTLNPGAINRNTRGFPDDYDGASVTYWNRRPKNWTVTAGISTGSEVFGADFSSSTSVRYNNNQGFGMVQNRGISLGKGLISLGQSNVDGESTYSLSINPAALLNKGKTPEERAINRLNRKEAHPFLGRVLNMVERAGRLNNLSLFGGNHGFCTFADLNRASQVTSYHGGAVNVSAGFQANLLPIPAGITANVSGSYSWQENDARDPLKAFGYMYAGDRTGLNSIQDYYVEKETPYNQRDLFLGAPFHNADIFSVSGEGMGGGFRLYHSKVGEFSPNVKSSTVQIFNISPEFAAGWTFGPGTDVGQGSQTLSEGAWQPSGTTFSTPNGTEDEGVSFRFINDLGGTWATAGQNDDAQKAKISNGILNTDELTAQRSHIDRTSRSSHIAYRTKEQLLPAGSINLLRTLTRRSDLSADMSISSAEIPNKSVCEMGVTSATGSKYIYGLPIFARNERNISYGVQGSTVNSDNYTINRPNKTDEEEPIKVGEERNTAYASSYLLTDVQSPDYVDRSLNGATRDDFGGYTRFQYEKKYALQNASSSLYHWRMPYNGLIYQRNSLSDSQDDMGSFASGDKEIAYLYAIQTKTHTAFFTTTARADGFEAAADAIAKAGTGAVSQTSKATYQLNTIELYENSQLGPADAQGKVTRPTSATPIKTVHFEYVNSANSPDELCKGLPNSTSGRGKLTLKRVWFSYNVGASIVPDTKRPYIFDYQYPNANLYPAKYRPGASYPGGSGTAGVDDVTRGLTTATSVQQNPLYEAHQLDAWGNYQTDGAARYAAMKPWLNQIPPSSFDPAAWQLKKITLPTGGEIHVQYEQDDYSYVQNKLAHAMAKVSSTSNSLPPGVFDLDLSEILDPNATNADNYQTMCRIRDAIQRIYVEGSEKIFFKFLYDLYDNSKPSINSCNAEFIKGYVDVTQVGIVNGKVEIKVEAQTSGGIQKLPKEVCGDFLRSQRIGKLNPTGICDPSVNGISDGGFTPGQLIRYIITRAAALYPTARISCGSMNPALSYFRIPMVTPKRGGGLRVKRLLMFDKGMDGQPVLYGNEYIYRMMDPDHPGGEISSGVATTEPGTIREENVLVTSLPRKTQGFISKITAGEDLKQNEGPIGESMLPAPSVGYSRVVVRNIHSGVSTPGYSVSEFATAREYPMLTKNAGMTREKDYFFIWAFLATSLRNNVYATQGYSFILNNMHGQIRRKASYTGYYTGVNMLKTKPVTKETYNYFEPPRQPSDDKSYQEAQAIPVMAGLRQQPLPMFPGKEIDMTYAQHSVKDKMNDLNFETDIEAAYFLFGFAFYPTIKPTLILTEAEFDTHVTSKVVRYPAIVRSIESTQDGITHTVTNLAFDQFTGQSVLSKSNDEFKGGYLQESVMASWIHPELGAKSALESSTISGGSFVPGQSPDYRAWLTFSANNCAGLGHITRGDQLVFANDDNRIYFADAPDFASKRVRLYPVSLSLTPPSLPASGAVSVTVLSSGRSNRLGAIASTTTYHNTDYQRLLALPSFVLPPISSTNGQQSLVQALSNLATAASSNITVTPLQGPYTHMNMSAYASKLLGSNCIPDPSDVTIKNLKVSSQTRNGLLNITLRSFEVVCESGIQPYEITIEN